MKAFGEPILEHFCTHDPNKAGFSLVQLIETSNISGHFVDKDGSFYLDIFSCKPFDIEVAIKVVKQFFEPEKVKMHFITRNAD
jgi:S-adenosylmethionine decarboxylase